MISIANLKPLQNTLMKRRFLPFLATILSLLLPVTAYSQSCADEFAGTSFELKSGYSGICEIDGVRFTDPSSEDLAVSADFEEAEIPDRGNYSVHDNTLSIGISSGNAALFTYTLSDLITEAGRNEYHMQMTGTITKRSGCTSTNNDHRTKIVVFQGNNRLQEIQHENPATGDFNVDLTFTASSKTVTFAISSDYSGDCYILNLTSISVTGCVDQKIVSENGETVCAGIENTLLAKGLEASSYSWESRVVGTADWIPMTETTQSIVVTPLQETEYMVTAGGITLDPISIRPQVCCSAAGDRTYDFENWAETFSFSGNRADMSVTSGTISNYTFAGSANVSEGTYALVKNASDGGNDGWYIDLPGHTSQMEDAPDNMKGANDGLLLINADPMFANSIFYKRVIDGLCPNTMYDFSAFIANVAQDPKGIPCNVRLVVYGGWDETVDETYVPIMTVESGNIAAGTSWQEHGASFNSESYTHVCVTIQDNVDDAEYDEEGQVVGNDIAIDDITFSTCSPEILLFSNDALTEQGGEYCGEDGADVQIHLEASAVYDLTDFFSTPYYLFQTSASENGPWTNVGGATTDPATDVTLAASQTSPVYYRVWVAADAATVETAASGGTLSGCGTVTAVSEPISLVYSCPCEDPVFDLSGSNMVCVSTPVAEFTAGNITDGLTYQWLKNGTVVDEGSLNGATEISYTDDNVAASEGEVVYSCIIFNGSCMLQKDMTVTVADRLDFEMSTSAENDRICAGETVTIRSNYALQSGESIEWYVDGVLLQGESGEEITLNDIAADTEITAELVGGICEGGGSITVFADQPAAPQIEVSESVICLGSSVDVTDSDVSDAEEYRWMVKAESETEFTVIDGETSKDLSAYVPETSCTIKKVSVNGNCEVESNEVSIDVQPAIVFELSATPATICKGQESELTMSGYPAGAQLEWIEDGNVISNEPTITVSPVETTTFTAIVRDVCTASKELTVEVMPPINAEIGKDEYAICAGQSVTLSVSGEGVTSYKWTPATGLDDSTSPTPVASPAASTEYSVTLSNGVCEETVSTKVNVMPNPYVTEMHDIQAENCGDRVLTIDVAGGTAPYTYSLDGINFTSDNSFSGLTSGWVEIYISDANQCAGDTTFYLEPYPVIPDKFFSPNDDNVNDIWNVANLDCYPEYVLQIFDRFGRKVFECRKGGFSSDGTGEEFSGWDGTYNGHQLPSADYWYLITVETIRKQYTGHFTLKR